VPGFERSSLGDRRNLSSAPSRQPLTLSPGPRIKGVGEGGAVAPPAAIADAVADALSPFGAEFNATPIKPE
jgi:CO/xanthine dehydrogenase Mo-binding subunit